MLTDDGLVEEGANGSIGGSQRIYRWGDYGLSLINSPMAHAYSYAWEAAVLDFTKDKRGSLTYDTPLTSDVEVFGTDEEANEFILRAKEYFTNSAKV